MEIKKCKKNAKNYVCDFCDFSCSRKSNYNIHILTRKHKWKSSGNEKNAEISCEKCGKTYKSTSGLWKHKQSCKICVNNNNKQEINSTLILKILEENNELRKMMKKQQDQISELIPQLGNNNNNTWYTG